MAGLNVASRKLCTRNVVIASFLVMLLFSGLISSSVAAIQTMWVFPSDSAPNAVTDNGARQTLINNSALSHVDTLYVSVYSSTPNAAGRLMYDEGAISDLITRAHTAGIKVYGAYGAPDWPQFGCSGFPLARMQEVVAYNSGHPGAKFDGVILDVEPNEPQDSTAYRNLLGLYDCMRNFLPAVIKLSVAIRFFWNAQVDYPPFHEVKPVYQHIIDLNLDHVVVMGYRDFAGPADCSTDGIICLDQDEIAYAGQNEKYDVVLVGLETSNPATTGISNRETFFEEGMLAMNGEAQTVLDHFGALSGLGGFAVHNYGNTYLAGNSAAWPASNPGFPLTTHEVMLTLVTKQPNGSLHMQGRGIPFRTYTLQRASTPGFSVFTTPLTTQANPTGAIDFQIVPSVGVLREFYRLTYP